MSYRNVPLRRSGGPSATQTVLPLGGEDKAAFGPEVKRPRYVQLLTDGLEELADKHRLSRSAVGLLAWLVLVAPRNDPYLRCSLEGLSEWLGKQRHRLRPLLAELEEAHLVRWQPGTGGQEGELSVAAYDELAAQGRQDAGRYVAIYADELDKWCSPPVRPGGGPQVAPLGFDARVLLLQVLLATDGQTRLVAKSVTDLASTLGLNRRRAAGLLGLDGELRGALQKTERGIEVTVYAALAATGRQAYRPPRDLVRGSRIFAPPSAELVDSTARFGPRVQDFCEDLPSPSEPRDLVRGSRTFVHAEIGSDEAQPRDLVRGSRDLVRGSRTFADHTLYLNTFLPYDGDGSGPGDGVTEGEGRKEEISQEPGQGQGRALIEQIVGRLGSARGDLDSASNAPCRVRLAKRLEELLAGGHTPDELLALADNLGPVDSVAAVILTRARDLETTSLASAREGAAQERAAHRRADDLEAARRYGQRRASVTDLDDESLDEDLVHYCDGDPELLAAARKAVAYQRAGG